MKKVILLKVDHGIKKLVNLDFEEEIFGIYIYSNDTAIIHVGKQLVKWKGFPNEKISTEVLYEDMNPIKSSFFYFEDFIYVLDGKNYLRYDGNELINVEDVAYIPTTTIARKPSGGGEILEDVNLIQSKRKNSFLGDGTSTEYSLDTTEIDSINSVYVDDVLVTNYTFDLLLGKVIFEEAPPSSVLGNDNVIIEFSKKIEGYSDRIKECRIAKVFDNRVFFTGNIKYSNVVFHCSLNNPAYISDLDYYECGSQENRIKSIVVGNNVLWVFKTENQNKDTIFYLTPSIDSDYGRIYPTSQGNVSVGCTSVATNYKDNIVFLSRNGLEGINGNIAYEQSVSHKSSNVDSKMVNMSNYEFAELAEYKDYLIIAIDNTLFLADNRQRFSGSNGTEFEWYVWQIPVHISCLKNYEGNLYFGDDKGNFYIFSGTNDLGEAINSYWTTPRDDFGYMNHLKKINKRGAIIKVKNVMNGRVKISGKTNKNSNHELIKEVATNGFDFDNLDFSNLSFSTQDHSYIVYRFKRKKIIDVSLKIYSDELDKPFGIASIILEAFLGGYVKRS